MSATLRRLHRWIGFVTGPFVVLFALSGVALLLRGPIEARLEGRPPAVRADGRVPATPDAIADIARVPFPGAEVRDDDAPIGVRRFYAFDPFGNRLELVDARDVGFTVGRA